MLAVLLIMGFLVTAIAIWRGSAERAVLTVFLPVMMLWPYGSGFRFKGVELDLITVVAVVLGLALVLKHAPAWNYTASDLMILLLCFSAMISNWNSDGQSAGLALGAGAIFATVPPYVIGRVALERTGQRVAFVRRFAFLAFVVSLISMWEYRMEDDPFRRLTHFLYQYDRGFHIQTRWGFGRIAGPYAHAILAGCVLICALILAMWVASENQWGRRFRRLEYLPGKKSTYIVLGLLLGVWMTQSRGPWLGGLFGVLLFLAGRAKNRKRAFRNVVLGSAILMTVFYVVLDRYTAVAQMAQGEDQQNAQYRRLLLVNYEPVVKHGGVLGYGLNFPVVDGQVSIDNEYLRVALTQGYFGLSVLLALILLTSYRLVRFALRSRDRSDGSFALALMGTFSTIVLGVTTVYMGAQVYTLFFLIAGWSQALEPARYRVPAAARVPVYTPTRFNFRKVWS